MNKIELQLLVVVVSLFTVIPLILFGVGQCIFGNKDAYLSDARNNTINHIKENYSIADKIAIINYNCESLQ